MKNIADKITLVPVGEEHLDMLCEEETNAELWKYEEYVDTDKDSVRKKFSSQIGCNYRYNFAVKNDADEVVGFCYIWIAQESRKSWEIGYIILPQYQRRGYAAVALKKLLRFAFQNLNAHKVMGMCNANNAASAKVMEKSGMRKQGVYRKEYLCNGEWVDQFYFSILDEDFSTEM